MCLCFIMPYFYIPTLGNHNYRTPNTAECKWNVLFMMFHFQLLLGAKINGGEVATARLRWKLCRLYICPHYK